MKCMILDADGMVLYGELFSEKFEKEHGLLEGTTQEFFTGVFQDCLVGKADLKESLVPYLEKWGWESSVEAFMEDWFATDVRKEIDVLNYLDSLDVFKILTTNNEKYRTERITEAIGNHFDVIISSSGVGHKKPHKEFFKHVQTVAQANGATSLMFWDDDENNIRGATAAGLPSHHYTAFEKFKEQVQDFLT